MCRRYILFAGETMVNDLGVSSIRDPACPGSRNMDSYCPSIEYLRLPRFCISFTMDLTLICECSEGKWLVFNDLDVRGLVEMDTWDSTTMIARTSSAMVAKVIKELRGFNINFVVTPESRDLECAVECPVCAGDLKNARALPSGKLVCSGCDRH